MENNLNKTLNSESLDKLWQDLQASPQGLTSEEAAARLQRDGPNILPKKKRETVLQIFLRQLINPIILLLIVTIIISFVLGEIIDACAIIFIVLIDLIMATFQEWRAGKNADSLSAIIKMQVLVLRDGEEQVIDSSQLVVGDIILLDSGDKLSADARILEAHNLNGVTYKNGIPDFSIFAVGEVKIDNMSSLPRPNYTAADEALASILGVSSRDIYLWRTNNNFTWHELNDATTMQLVPTAINTPIFGHLGGRSELRRNGG